MKTYEASIDALADARRRELLELLRRKPATVGELTDRLPISQPAVSQHLRVLRDANLVKVEPRGTSRIYSIDPAGLVPVRAYIESFWDDALGAFAEAANRIASEAEEEV